MNFYHCTTSKNAKRILRKEPSKINPSVFEYSACLNDWLSEILNPYSPSVNSERFFFPRFYYSQGENMDVFWLGTGLYCFSEEYKTESPIYAKKNDLDVILELHYCNQYTEFDMYASKDLLKKFLNEIVLAHFINNGFSGEKLEALKLLIEFLTLEIEDEYFSNPHCAAIVLEMYLHLCCLNFDVVSNKFLKNVDNFIYDNYCSIRNIELISKVEYNYDLSHKIRA